jgi:hypothetical protein
VSGLARLAERVHRVLLACYPADFRAEFGEEMQGVFEKVAATQKSRGTLATLFLRELRDLPGSLLNAYTDHGFLGGNISTKDLHIAPATRWQAFIGVLPFLAFGAASMIGKVGHIYHFRGHNAEMVVYFLALAGLLVGWRRDFPLWSYSYLGWALVIAWSNTTVTIYGVDWGYRIWLAFGITVLIVLLWTRSLEPIKKFFHDIWNDWTRLSLAMFTMGAWIWMTYDENHHPYLLAFMLASTLAAAGGAWIFLRSSSAKVRILSIVGGFIAVAIIGGICYATWDWRAYYGFPKPDEVWYKTLGIPIIGILFWLPILFWPALIGAIHRMTAQRTA